MSAKDRTARRYHWIKEGLCKDSFVVEPHEAIVGEIRREVVLDLTAKGSEECRETSVDLSKEKPRKVKRLLESVRPVWQKSLLEWVPGAVDEDYTVDVLSMPRRVNWNALREAYEFQPKNYEALLLERLYVLPLSCSSLCLSKPRARHKKSSLRALLLGITFLHAPSGMAFKMECRMTTLTIVKTTIAG